MSKDPEKAVVNNDSEEEIEEDDADGEGAGDNVSSQLLKNPAVMAALQNRLDSMVGAPSDYIKVIIAT